MQPGFAEAAQAKAQATPPVEVVKPVDERATMRATMRADLRQYLDVQAQHPEAIILVKSPDLRFYKAFLEGVQQTLSSSP
ncbi:MAG: hypothetical protein ACHWZW_15145 [Spirulina sp.]